MPTIRRRSSPGMEMYRGRGGLGSFQLLSYGYKPSPLWKGGEGEEPGLAYYGMEIEISCGRLDTMAWAAENFGTDLVYLKHDGSVRGFEMVTHPMTFPWALEHFPWNYLSELRGRGCSIEPENNGIHVHVSRSGFSGDAHTLRWFKLLYRNKENVTRIARRNSSWGTFSTTHQRGQLAHLKSRKGTLAQANAGIMSRVNAEQLRLRGEIQQAEREYRRVQHELNARYDAAYELSLGGRRDREINRIYDEEQANSVRFTNARSALERASNARIVQIRRGLLEDTTGARYSAVNTNPRETFEVRAFASTLDPVSAQSTIGLVAAAVEYTRPLTVHDIIKNEALTWPRFAAWLDENPLYAAVKYANEHAVYPHSARAAI